MQADIFTEPPHVDMNTLRNLGPLEPLAGVWEGEGADRHALPGGAKTEGFHERIVFEPIDPQTNGPQLLYGLYYRIHITRPGERLTFHDQVGYWLWEPATGNLLQTIAIPRGEVALARGRAERDARTFDVKATLGSTSAGIISSPYLTENFLTLEYALTIFIGSDSFSYEQDTVLRIAGRGEPFHHQDRNTLRRIALPRPNPAVARDAR